MNERYRCSGLVVVAAVAGAAVRLVVRVALVTLVVVGPVHAQGGLTPRVSLDAFGALGVSHSTQDHADYVESTSRPAGPGFTHRLDPRLDSRIAGQATLLAGSRLSAVVQVMVEQQADGDYRPRAEWANVGYAISPDLAVRGGRIVLSAFLVSDARKVSYANPWIRPPVELYGMVPIYTLEGADATYRHRLGEWTGSVNAAAGRAQMDFPGGSVEGKQAWNVNATFARGELTARIAAAGVRLEMDVLSELLDGFRAFGPEGEAIADRYEVRDRVHRFAAAGMELDRGEWFTLAEGGWFGSRSAIGDRLAGYATAGVRWRAFTSYATYARSNVLSESSTSGLSTTGLPGEHAHFAAQLNAGLNAFIGAAPSQQSLAFGGRWDFMPGVALKAQLDFVDMLGRSAGTFINLQPGFESGGHARLFSVATTFVF